MIAIHDGAKFIRANELIPMYNLILRWPFQSIFKLPLHMRHSQVNKKLRTYELLEQSWTIEKETFYHIKEINWPDFHTYYSNLQKIVFLLSEVESIEEDSPEYRAYRDPVEGEYDFYLSTPENMNIIISLIFYVCSQNGLASMNLTKCRNLVVIAVRDGKLDGIVNEYCTEEGSLYPPQLKCFATVKPLTLFEKAQKFVAQRPANNDFERSLLYLELERRFPELKREDVGRLLYYDKKNEDIEVVILPSSYAKRCDRAQIDAHIYRNLA